MDTILINLRNSKTSDRHWLVLKNSKRSDIYMAYSNLLINHNGKT